jgi:hypothetical protein
VRRDTKEHPGGNSAIIFKFTPTADYDLDPKIGYQLIVKAQPPKTNSAVRYISHNQYRIAKQIVLDPNGVYNLTGGDSTNVTWSVTVVMASDGFDDQNNQALGTVINCGPSSNTRSIFLNVQG